MVAYVIVILLIIKNLKVVFPGVTNTWYDNYASALCTFSRVGSYFNLQEQIFPGRAYYPVPSKIFLIVHLDNIEDVKSFGLCHGFKVCTVMHYLGGLIGDDKSKCDWLREECTLTWEKNINMISETTGKYPQ